MSIANYFTFIRIFISPIFLLVYLHHDYLEINPSLLPYVLLFLLGVSELSDAFDGYLARKYNQVTDFGKILDPMADSIARLSYFLTFTAEPVRLPLALIFIFVYRDSVVSTLRTICALKGFALAARTSGKIKAGIQAMAALTVLILMIPHSLGYLSSHDLQYISTWVVGIAGIYTAYSGVDYVYANRQYIAKLLSLHPAKP
ncbi:CDP-diacylglycerol--glycerol-3-phosphate 3-phosphatidyltransferase [Neochlamydia sp. S13]|uniref:CDP-diacylglycerol--glycerol-3-phosphate 3-phosphatidyltransferase n=1 Tax=Neochlamydia sp. S13 TaxID=1353976 RepID=UPI0005A93624|nr:CDP-diacylglycerol--glycerol-3-phosphate 3-phosphatidyltransferase [Neochlamydia sp. S13]BBI16505.1 phosphatidylglycerophosphate synthase [Neochlamydia sp. S13]